MSADVDTHESKKFKNLEDSRHYNGYINAKVEKNTVTMNRQNNNNNNNNNNINNNHNDTKSSSKQKSSLDYQQQIDLFKKYTEIKKAPSQTIDQTELNNRLSLIINDKGMPTLAFESRKKTTAAAAESMEAAEKSQSSRDLTNKKHHQSLFSLSKNKSSKEQINHNNNKNSTEAIAPRHFSNSPAKTTTTTTTNSVKNKNGSSSIVTSPKSRQDGKPPKPKERAKSNSFIKRLSFRFKSHSTESTDQTTGEFDNKSSQKESINNKSTNETKTDATKTTKNQSSIDLDSSYSSPDYQKFTTTKTNFKPQGKASSQILYSEYRDNDPIWQQHGQQANSNQFLNNSNLNYHQSYTSEQEINYLNIDTMKKVFNVFDRDHDGSITIEDVQEVMNSLSYLKNEIEMPSIEQIKIAFEKFDENKNGSIEFNEFLNILKSAAAQSAENEDSIQTVSNTYTSASRLADNSDYTNDNVNKANATYNYTASNEFNQPQPQQQQQQQQQQLQPQKSSGDEVAYDLNQFNNDFSELVRANMKLIFEQFDKDNDGRITRHELSFVMCNLFPDENITSQDIDEMLHAADLDNNGFIDFEEFANMFNLYKKNSANGNIERIDEQTVTNPYYKQSLANINNSNSRGGVLGNNTTTPADQQRLDRKDKSANSKPTSRSNSKEGSKQARVQSANSSKTSSPQPNNYRKVVQIFTTSQLMDLKAAFTMFDKNGDQKISESELLQVMEYLGCKTTEKEVRAMIQVVDKNRNGYVDYDEFIQMMTQTNIKPLSAEEELKKTFDIFDIDRNGFICADEIKTTMLNLGENLTDEEVRDMIKAADKNGDGKIDLNEFSGLLSGASIFHAK